VKISKDRFFSVGSDLQISKEKIEAFWEGLEPFDESGKSTLFSQWLFYLGALVVIGAMTWFMTLGWNTFGGSGIFLIAAAYALFFFILGNILWRKEDLRIPGGLSITIAVCMVPLAIYGLELYFNLWPSDNAIPYRDYYQIIKGQWVYMELGTILAAILALCFYPFPFLTAPLVISAWFLSMDLFPWILGRDLNWDQKSWVSLIFGLILLTISLFVDRRSRRFAFWCYLFGTIAFWGGLNGVVWDEGEPVLVLYLCINLLLMFLSVLIRRHVLMVFGAFGVFIYLAHLAYSIFENSILFPIILSLIGLAIIFLGIFYQRNAKSIEAKLLSALPKPLKSFLNLPYI
jgi:hypothetical protein